MAVANFHFHTRYSDGQCSPTEAVNTMYKHGYDILIKTDHDTVEGCAEAENACNSLNIESFNGIEITSSLDSDLLPEIGNSYAMHVLGLGINGYLMDKELTQIRSTRNDSLSELARLLISDGYALRKDILFRDCDYITERAFIARELVEIGRAQDVTEAYACILNKAPYVEYSATLPTAQATINMIHRSGGLAILAHPLTLKKGGSIMLEREKSFALINRLVSYGLDGIESYYLRYDNDNIAYLSNVADSFGLLKSCGSDLHTRKQIEVLDNRYDDAASYSTNIYPLIDRLISIKLGKNIKR